MEGIVFVAALGSILVYLSVGFYLGRRTKNLADHLPIRAGQGNLARVANDGEFSASTVAATISLATVVMAFFELVPYFGLWLLWTVVTTSLGVLVVRLAAGRILKRMAAYGERRPTLHDFLGTEYESRGVAILGAMCTSLGFLGAFAVELTVGSRFLSNLLPTVAPILLVIILASVSLIYTSAGGFRAVIVTDVLQMRAIWLLLGGLSIFYAVYLYSHGGINENLLKIPSEVYDFSWRDGLTSFLVGIFIINVPTFVSDMSVWQRIAGTGSDKIVLSGLWKSIVGVALTWTLFVLLATLAYTIATPTADENPLLTLLHNIPLADSFFYGIVLFVVVIGLYGALFSAASTQLVAVSHTVHLDILHRNKKDRLDVLGDSSSEVWISRSIIWGAALLAMIIVEGLSWLGFSIADLVFAVFGAQLGLFPPTLLALFLTRDRLRRLKACALVSIGLGFVAGWSSAIFGKVYEMPDLVFLAPVVSLVTSSLVIGFGVLTTHRKTEK